MGYYINVEVDKETWLRKNGHKTFHPEFQSKTSGKTTVCLIDNVIFTAAGICFSEKEFQEFNKFDDGRHREWFYVPVEKILEVCPKVENRLE